MTSSADNRGIFGKRIHFYVEIGELVTPGEKFNQELIMLFQAKFQVLHCLFFG